MGIIGYLFRPLYILNRILFGGIGLLLILPVKGLEHGIYLNIFGFIAGFAVVGYEYYHSKQNKRTSEKQENSIR